MIQVLFLNEITFWKCCCFMFFLTLGTFAPLKWVQQFQILQFLFTAVHKNYLFSSLLLLLFYLYLFLAYPIPSSLGEAIKKKETAKVLDFTTSVYSNYWTRRQRNNETEFFFTWTTVHRIVKSKILQLQKRVF